MPPKKREKDVDSSKNPRIDHIQADHELFLQAFEKPTQIYRYLRTRNICSPIFLNRTLTYMKHRMSRPHRTRTHFKINTLLQKVIDKRENAFIQPGYINLTFLGFTDSSLNVESDFVQVETFLLKLSHKKRKDCSATSVQISLGTAEVPINPLDRNLPPLTAPTICIPTESFNNINGPSVKSFALVFKVKIKIRTVVDVDVMEDDEVILIKDENSQDEDDEEPATKKRKSSSSPCNNTESSQQHQNFKFYTSELTIYDKHNRCYLTDGDYDIVLQDFNKDLTQKLNQKKHSSWENVKDLIDTCGTLDNLLKGAILKFKLNWSSEECAKIVERPKLYPLMENNKENNSALANNNGNNNINEGDNINHCVGGEKLQIVYQFVYNNNSRQQTEACEDLHCPWCSLNCNELYTLLKHLKLCHSRFTFTYVPISVGARIDVAINEMYDGSYTGSPHDLIMQPTVCAFSRNGPVRRASVTHILVCHPKRSKPSLSEFLELDDCEYDGQRPFITGHNRLYHHTTTCLPIYPKEMDIDSEGENDPEWLQNKTMMMIDEFTDVNEGEKQLMKMWNLHVMKYGFVGDCQIPLACQMFVQQKGKELLLKNLYRNFVLHMTSLFDFGLISAVCLYTTLQKLQQMIVGEETQEIRNVLKNSRQAQLAAFKTNPLLMSPHNNFEKNPILISNNIIIKTTPQSGRKIANVGLLRRSKDAF